MTEKTRADPEKERKKFIKKVVREELAKNSKLERFLTDRGIKGQYIVNTTNRLLVQRWYNREEDVVNAVKNRIHSLRAIDRSFTWAATPQGHNFWRDLQDIYSEENHEEDDPFYKMF